MMRMPGLSHRGAIPPLTTEESALADRLRGDVAMLAGEIGERNILHYHALHSAADYIGSRLNVLCLPVCEETSRADDKMVSNIVAEHKGRVHPDEIVVIGAHYDSVVGSPGANDNASGVAPLLELARFFKESKPARTIRLVAFVNEEPPYFKTEEMGSLVHARQARKQGDKVVAMLALETIGCYSDLPKSQHYPSPFSLTSRDGRTVWSLKNLHKPSTRI
jgi:acetylornithine deacetylase/succinyl-diaminopimelate desuccinylase-like protein